MKITSCKRRFEIILDDDDFKFMHLELLWKAYAALREWLERSRVM